MKGISICHYSFHRTWVSRKWDCRKLAKEVKALGASAVDFHARLLGERATAVTRIREALAHSDLALSGLSLSNNFHQEERSKLEEEIAGAISWIRVAAEVGAPVSRIFGGHLPAPLEGSARDRALTRVIEALGTVTREAERLGVVLGLENHGGFPCSGEEQVRMIEAIGSASLGATIDIGNYLSCGQESWDGTAVAAPRAVYVHVKDMKKLRAGDPNRDWKPEACIAGTGDVDLPRCLAILRDVGYEGYLALEYEASEEEEIGVRESMAFLVPTAREVFRR